MEEILEEVAQATGLEYDLRWGGALFSTPERLWPGPGEVSSLHGAEGNPAGPHPVLDREITLDCYHMTPVEILRRVERETGMRIRLRGSRLSTAGPLRLHLMKMRVRDVLSTVVRPYGDGFRLEEGGVVVEPSGR